MGTRDGVEGELGSVRTQTEPWRVWNGVERVREISSGFEHSKTCRKLDIKQTTGLKKAAAQSFLKFSIICKIE